MSVFPLKKEGFSNSLCQSEKWTRGDESEKKVKLFINKARYPKSTGKKKKMEPYTPPSPCRVAQRQRWLLPVVVRGGGQSSQQLEPVGFLAWLFS